MKPNNEKDKNEVTPGFGRDADGNVFIAHDTSFDKSNRKKEKKKTEIKGKEFDTKSIVDVEPKSDEEEGNANKMVKKFFKMIKNGKKDKINLNSFGS